VTQGKQGRQQKFDWYMVLCISGQDTSVILNAQLLSQSLLKILGQFNHLFVSFSPVYAQLSST